MHTPTHAAADRPAVLNVVLAAAASVAAIGLLMVASATEGWPRFAAAMLFSFVLLTNYALMHEAAHGVAQTSLRANRVFGAWVSVWFPVSFSLYRTAHIAHHCSNKTDLEMFDYYYPDDSKLLKFSVWYAILVGLNWIVLPLGSLGLSADARLLRRRPFNRMATIPRLAQELDDPRLIRRIRHETLATIAFWSVLATALALDPLAIALCYACFAFNWSTRQYLTHAFAPREVVTGAHNLAVSAPMRWVLLNGHLDLVHHQHPALPWTRLPAHAAASRAPVDAWKLYLAMWRGPRPNREPAPTPLPRHDD